ncbi:MAG: phosphotransferase family protein, partial [Solirubrobacterales bacterium]
AGPPRWVLRLDPSGAESFLPLAVEHGVVSTAAAAGVPVPRPLGFEPAGGQFGNAGYLMEHVEGTSVPPRVLRRDELAAARERLPTQLAESLARIHAIDPARIAGVTGGDRDPALEACELWERELDAVGEPLPAVEAGLRSLRLDPPPAPDRVALVHGDFRLGNFIVDGEGLAAVIDWELCHAGDPADDIGWLVIRSWRFGNDGLPVAGLGELEPLLAAYEAAGGARPSADRLRWWEAMGNVKWAVICARQAHDHLSGTRPSAELASLGRRICEPEWDLLELLATPDATGAGAASGAPEES